MMTVTMQNIKLVEQVGRQALAGTEAVVKILTNVADEDFYQVLEEFRQLNDAVLKRLEWVSTAYGCIDYQLKLGICRDEVESPFDDDEIRTDAVEWLGKVRDFANMTAINLSDARSREFVNDLL